MGIFLRAQSWVTVGARVRKPFHVERPSCETSLGHSILEHLCRLGQRKTTTQRTMSRASMVSLNAEAKRHRAQHHGFERACIGRELGARLRGRTALLTSAIQQCRMLWRPWIVGKQRTCLLHDVRHVGHVLVSNCTACDWTIWCVS